MRLFAGADAGQSGTRLVLGDERGNVVARVHGGPCYYGDGRHAGQRIDFLQDLARAALSEFRTVVDSPDPVSLWSLVAGISGFDEHTSSGWTELGTVSFRHDSAIAHAGALAGGSGVVVIAGSGSVALGIDGGRRVRMGGWGYMFGDEGSAFWIGRTAITTAMRAVDVHKDGAPAPGSQAEELTRLILHSLKVGSLREVQRGFMDGTLARTHIAALATPLIAFAQHYPGSGAAQIVVQALAHLGELANETAAQLGVPGGCAISYAGGLFADAWFAREFAAAIAPPNRAVAPAYPPEIGALVLAYRNARVAVVPFEPRS